MDKGLGQFKSKPVQESLKIMAQCPLCKKSYSGKETQIIDEKNGAHLVHITCPHCHQAVLALVVISQVGMSTVGMVTDLNREDVARLCKSDIISEDELLNFHTLLQREQLNFN